MSIVGAKFAATIRTRQNNVFFGNGFDVAGTGAPMIPLNPLWMRASRYGVAASTKTRA